MRSKKFWIVKKSKSIIVCGQKSGAYCFNIDKADFQLAIKGIKLNPDELYEAHLVVKKIRR